MPVQTTPIAGLLVYTPPVYPDSRGYFFEAYNERIFHEAGIETRFVQDNQSRSSYGVIRGLHYQQHPHAQAKLVRVLAGAILDVAVDIRRSSPTYGQHFSIELNADNQHQLFIPAGFAHGFSVLSESAVVFYKCDQFYNKASEGGIRYDDPALGIDWCIPADKAVVSDKDLVLPTLEQCVHNFKM